MVYVGSSPHIHTVTPHRIRRPQLREESKAPASVRPRKPNVTVGCSERHSFGYCMCTDQNHCRQARATKAVQALAIGPMLRCRHLSSPCRDSESHSTGDWGLSWPRLGVHAPPPATTRAEVLFFCLCLVPSPPWQNSCTDDALQIRKDK